MAGKSDYLENKYIDWLFRAQSFTPPATIYVALLTAAPSDSGGGTEVSTSGTNYARQGVVGGLTAWAGTQAAASTTASSGTGGATSNNGAVTFGVPSATWGLCTHFALYDAVTTGNLLYWGPLTANKNVNNGDPAPSFPAGTLVVTED